MNMWMSTLRHREDGAVVQQSCFSLTLFLDPISRNGPFFQPHERASHAQWVFSSCNAFMS